MFCSSILTFNFVLIFILVLSFRLEVHIVIHNDAFVAPFEFHGVDILIRIILILVLMCNHNCPNMRIKRLSTYIQFQSFLYINNKVLLKFNFLRNHESINDTNSRHPGHFQLLLLLNLCFQSLCSPYFSLGILSH